MPLFSSSSPFDQDVGEYNRIAVAFLCFPTAFVVDDKMSNNLPFQQQRKRQVNSIPQMIGNLLWKSVTVFHGHRLGL